MKSYVISVVNNKLSYESAQKTIISAKNVGGVDVELWNGFHKNQATDLMKKHQFKILDYDVHWTQFQHFEPAISCFFSHYYLWEHCVELNERIMILEHDALFHKKFIDYDFEGVVNIGEPNQWQIQKQKFDFDNIYKKRTQEGLIERNCTCKEKKYEYGGCHCIEYFLQGAHSYVITPEASKNLIIKAKAKGILPADFHINRENIKISDSFPYCVHANQTFSLIHKEVHDGRDVKIPKGDIAWND